MAKYLNTTGVSYELENIIKKAKERIYLVSPYLQLNERVFGLLENADRLKLDIRIVYGKSELHPDQSEKLKQLKSVRVLFAKSLHAKCYLNESSAIVTSMNLYEFSQVNNFEMGILVDRSTDAELFNDINEDVVLLIRQCDEVQISVVKVPPKVAPATSAVAPTKVLPRASREATVQGFCIRCKTDLPLNPKKPYCGDDYVRWAEYENEDYVDKFCHGCGKKHGASMRKPLCRDCWAGLAA